MLSPLGSVVQSVSDRVIDLARGESALPVRSVGVHPVPKLIEQCLVNNSGTVVGLLHVLAISGP